MKYVLVALFLVAVAGAEIFHELSGDPSAGAQMCMAPQSAREAIHEFLLHHLQSHR
jgi:hypothetical protein